MKTLIKNGLLIDPANQVQSYLNLILEDGKVEDVTEEEPEADRVKTEKLNSVSLMPCCVWALPQQ